MQETIRKGLIELSNEKLSYKETLYLAQQVADDILTVFYGDYEFPVDGEFCVDIENIVKQYDIGIYRTKFNGFSSTQRIVSYGYPRLSSVTKKKCINVEINAPLTSQRVSIAVNFIKLLYFDIFNYQDERELSLWKCKISRIVGCFVLGPPRYFLRYFDVYMKNPAKFAHFSLEVTIDIQEGYGGSGLWWQRRDVALCFADNICISKYDCLQFCISNLAEFLIYKFKDLEGEPKNKFEKLLSENYQHLKLLI